MKPKSMCIYSDTGMSKTTQGYFIAKWIWETFRLKTRVICADGGGVTPYTDSGMVRAGIAEVFDISNTTQALAMMRALSQGYWPIDGQIAFDERYMTHPETWKTLGLYVVEGMTSVCQLWLDHMSSRKEKVGFKHSFTYEEGPYFFGGLQEGHYGLAQNELYKIHSHGFACLPVPFLVWTALVGSGRDKLTGDKVFGPRVAGVKKTAEVPSWVQDCIHIDDIPVDTQQSDGKIIRTLYRVGWYERHYDQETATPFLAKTRVLPEYLGTLHQRLPGGYVQLTYNNGLDVYLQTLLEIRKQARQEMEKKWTT